MKENIKEHYAQPNIQLFNCDNVKLMAEMEDESVDVILTDPPYLYLKNQKLERLLALVVPKEKEREDIVVADFFGGSFSTMEAVFNMGMQGIACEIDKEYFEAGKERIEKLPPRQTTLFD